MLLIVVDLKLSLYIGMQPLSFHMYSFLFLKHDQYTVILKWTTYDPVAMSFSVN